jgi:LPXTG-site transpeptidase (sortase) family protein
MRNTGVVIILTLFGIALWMAFDREHPVVASSDLSISDPSVISARDSAVSRVEEKSTEILADQFTVQVEVNEIEVPSVPEPERFIPLGIPNEISHPAEHPQPIKEYDRLVIPTLKVNSTVKSKPYAELTWDLTGLGHEIAFLGNVPGQETENNLVFAGHVTVRNGSNGPFRYLRKLAPGDKIILYKDQLKYTYSVLEQVLVYPDEISVLEDSLQPRITLITCITWDEKTLSYLRRLIVTAELEKIEVDQNFFE